MSRWSIIHQHFVHSTFSFSRTAHNSIISWVDSCFSPLKTNFPFFLKIDDSFFFFVFLEWKCFNRALLLNGFVGAHSELHLLSVEGTWVGHTQRLTTRDAVTSSTSPAVLGSLRIGLTPTYSHTKHFCLFP